MKEQGKIYSQHSENTEWSNKLNFYRDELDILKKRLAEIAAKNNQQEVMKEVEHFQNQFIIQSNNIDEIAHTVRMNEKTLVEEMRKNPVAVDHRKVDDHTDERELVNGFEKNLIEIRNEFNRFASKWL